MTKKAKNTKPTLPAHDDQLWTLWAEVEAGYVMWRNTAGNRKKKSTLSPTRKPHTQQERWHLRCLHAGSAMQHLAEIVSDQVLQHYGEGRKTIRFSYESCWIDKVVQAHWKSVTGAQRSVELGDLLVLVKRNVNGVVTKHGMVMQAKCVDDPDRLDRVTCAHGETSSQRERELLETATGPIELKLNGVSKSYDVPRESVQKPGIRDYARYLLIPRGDLKTNEEWRVPYVTLWPSARKSQVGEKTIYPDLIAHMGGVDVGNAADPLSRPIIPDSEWGKMVNDILSWAKSHKGLERFDGFETYRRDELGAWWPIARSPRRWYVPLRYRLWWPRLVTTIRRLGAFSGWRWLIQNPVLYAVPVSPLGNGGTDDSSNDEDGGGMVILQIAITVSDDDDLEKHDREREFD